MGLREQAVKGVAWSAVQNWGSRAVNFVVFLVLARLLQPEAFGLVALAGVYITLIEVFVDQGFADAVIQREDLTSTHLDTAFWTNLGLSVIFVIGSLALARPLAALMNEPELVLIIQWFSPAFILAALTGVQQALFERDLNYRTLAIRELVADSIGGGSGIVMALMGYGVWSLVGYQLVRRAANVVVLWTASDWRPGLLVGLQPFKDLFSFGVNIVGSNLLGFLNNRLDNLLVGAVLGPTALGFYDVAYRLFNVGTQLVTGTVSSVAFSTFSRLQDDVSRMRQGFYTATRLVSTIAFPMFLGGALVAPELIEVVFGAKWLPSAPVFQVLAFIGILHSVFYFKAAVLMAAGRPDWRLGISAANAVGNAVAFALVVRWGIVAVATAYVLRGYLLAPLLLIAVRALINIRWRNYFEIYTTPLVGVAVMASVVVGSKVLLPSAWSAAAILGTVLPLAAATYVLALWFMERERLEKIVNLLKMTIPQGSSAD